uniref:Uncharacterized protein n=1 Tax=Bactrocera latifrons TaxID=174628 RepID=A0A0K8WIP0_BACLA
MFRAYWSYGGKISLACNGGVTPANGGPDFPMDEPMDYRPSQIRRRRTDKVLASASLQDMLRCVLCPTHKTANPTICANYLEKCVLDKAYNWLSPISVALDLEDLLSTMH